MVQEEAPTYNSFIHPLNKHLLRVYSTPASGLRTRDIMTSRRDSVLREAERHCYSLWVSLINSTWLELAAVTESGNGNAEGLRATAGY